MLDNNTLVYKHAIHGYHFPFMFLEKVDLSTLKNVGSKQLIWE